MRIISGQFKSRRITAPKNLPVRPTTDRAKEALFNILGHQYYLDEIAVLDLFAGIGSITFEFASRGTTNITTVDKHRNCIEFIKKTAEDLQIEVNLINQDVLEYLEKTTNSYDIVFADPPYDFSEETFISIIDSVFDNEILTEKGIFILEHSKHTDLSTHKKFDNSRTYGHSEFSWFS